MIFSLSKGMYTAVLLGDKTLTTRLRLPAHTKVGREVAFVPGRAKSAWWINILAAVPYVVTNPQRHVATSLAEPALTQAYCVDYLKRWGFVQTRLIVDGFWETPLQRMTELEALDEGVNSLAEYALLWDAINGKGSWAANPDVWRIKFRRTDALVAAVERVGRTAILEARDSVLGKVTA